MNYCSNCGHPVLLRTPDGDERPRYVCVQCATIHYVNPRVLVGCLTYMGDRVLAGRRAKPPDAGKWNVPSGFVEQGESLEQAAARETLEETGVTIEPARLELYAVFSLPTISQIYVVLRTELSELPQTHCGAECSEVKFISEQDIERGDLAFVVAGIDTPAILFDELNSNSFAIHKWCLDGARVRDECTRAYAIR